MRQAKVTERVMLLQRRNAKIKSEYQAEMRLAGAMSTAVIETIAAKYNLTSMQIYRILKNS